jgi:hypothetical protein
MGRNARVIELVLVERRKEEGKGGEGMGRTLSSLDPGKAVGEKDLVSELDLSSRGNVDGSVGVVRPCPKRKAKPVCQPTALSKAAMQR